VKRPRAAAGAGAALAAAALLAAGPEPPATFERGIDVGRPGKVVPTLDREVYERARPDLGDLRVVDETGADAPYLLERVGSDPEPTFREPVAINRVFVRGRSASVTLDLREPMLRRAQRSVSFAASRRIHSDARRLRTTSAERSAPHSRVTICA